LVGETRPGVQAIFVRRPHFDQFVTAITSTCTRAMHRMTVLPAAMREAAFVKVFGLPAASGLFRVRRRPAYETLQGRKLREQEDWRSDVRSSAGRDMRAAL
jgi:hypothetical protein